LVVTACIPTGDAPLPNGDGCQYEPVPLAAPTEVTTLGFSPAGFLAELEGTKQATLTWHDRSPELEVFPPPGSTALTVDVTPEGTPLYLRGTASEGLRLACPDRMEVAATVRTKTADGGLDETWRLTISSEQPLAPRFGVDLLRMAVRGSFRASWRNLSPNETTTLELSAELSRRGTTGRISSARVVDQGSRGFASGTFVASWDPNPSSP
jgi:hypothetical protein